MTNARSEFFTAASANCIYFDLLLFRVFSLLFINNYMTDSEYKLRQATLNWMVAQAEKLYAH